MGVRAVVLDIGGVLEFTPPTGRVEKWEARLGLEAGELQATIDEVVQPGCVGEVSYEAMLSNSFVGAREREEEAYDFSEICEFTMYAHEEGLLKPDPAFYLLACERLDVAPHEVVFVDDKQVCVDAARELGMQAVRFTDTAQTIADIERCLATATRPAVAAGG